MYTSFYQRIAVADSSSSSSEENAIQAPILDRNRQRIDDPVLYKRAVAPGTLHLEIIEDHVANNNYARTGGLQFLRRRGDSPDENERPRGRPGPSRSDKTDVAPSERHLEHDPKHRRPAHLTAPGEKHHPKPTDKPKPKPGHGKPDHGKPGKPHKPKPKPTKTKTKSKSHKPTHRPTHTHKPKPKPTTTHKPKPKPTTTTTTTPATVPTVVPVVPPQPPVVPTTPSAPVLPTSPPAVIPPAENTGSPGQNLPSGGNNNGSPNEGAGGQSTSGHNATPGSLSGSSSSSTGTIVGAVVGSVALAGLVALGVYRRRERQRAVEEATGPNPEMDEAPRTAFRHESFMALVKDAAQGFYAPGTASPTPGGPGPSGLSGVVVAAGAGTGGSSLSRQASARSQNSQHSLHSRRSGQFSAHGMTPSSPPPPLAHIGGR